MHLPREKPEVPPEWAIQLQKQHFAVQSLGQGLLQGVWAFLGK
jgi:hypothetical protein